MKKRAVVTIQFNWIFILIVGALILFFFIRFIEIPKASTEQAINYQVLNNIDAVLFGLDIEVGVTDNESLGGTVLEIGSNKLAVAGSKRVAKTLQNKIIFSPDVLQGNKLIIHTDYWSLPFIVDYFIYLTSNEIRYIIVDDPGPTDDAKISQLKKLLPQGTSYEEVLSIDLSELLDTNNYKVRLIFFDKDPGAPNLVDIGDLNTHADVSAIKIIPGENSDSLDTYGSVKYYEKARRDHNPAQDGPVFVSKEETAYLGNRLLLGAILSENREYYEEQTKKALKKLAVVGGIYRDNAISLKTYSENDPYLSSPSKECDEKYDLALLDNLVSEAEAGVSLQNFENIQGYAERIDIFNDILLKSSCLPLY